MEACIQQELVQRMRTSGFCEPSYTRLKSSSHCHNPGFVASRSMRFLDTSELLIKAVNATRHARRETTLID